MFATTTLAFAAPTLKFDDPDLQSRVEFNLKTVHTGCEWSAVLLLAAKGDLGRKKECLERWIATFRVNPSERAVLEAIATNGFVPNPYFQGAFSEAQRYIIFRLCEGFAPAASAEGDAISLEAMRIQMEAHPLVHSYFDLTVKGQEWKRGSGDAG